MEIKSVFVLLFLWVRPTNAVGVESHLVRSNSLVWALIGFQRLELTFGSMSSMSDMMGNKV